MIVYRDQARTVATREAIHAIPRRAADHESHRELLIEFGRLECGLADALAPDDPRAGDLRRIAVLAGRGFYRSLRGLPTRDCLEQIGRELNRLSAEELPETIELRTPEGYAFYGLFPENYIAAAELFFSENHPSDARVIGIRSIGTSLSGVVAGTLAELGTTVESLTVRPKGHPFDRVTDLPAVPVRDAPHLIVDEGPGLSGSSFASVARALSDSGVPDSRIVFFPAWRPDPGALLSREARQRWARHRIFTAEFDPEIARRGLREWHEISAGEWRRVLLDDVCEYPAVHPQHERRKLLSRGPRRILAKFAGFGSRGRACFERMQALHDARFVPAPIEIVNGFLYSRFVSGRAVSRLSPELMGALLRYLAHIAREFPAAAPPQDLVEMTVHNVSEAAGCAWSPSRELLEPLADARAILLDGRMLPHEWIETARGFLKTDAADHGDDHFFPGPQDIAWDLAAAAVEFSIPDPRELLERFASITGDRQLHRRFPFYALSYAAFRLGYCELAQKSLRGAEQARFKAARERYRRVIHRYTGLAPR